MTRIFIIILFTAGLLFRTCNTFSQQALTGISLSQPVENQIVQRNISGTGIIYITGYHDIKLSFIEARLVPENTENTDIQWQILAIEADEGIFTGTIQGSAGWHKLEIRGTSPEGQSFVTQVNRVGIGEIFVIGGASNSMGMADHGSKSASSNVISFNQVNKTLDNDGITVVPDQPYDFPVFSRYEAENYAYPTGESAWCWGELGDKIYQKTNCPVLFLNVGWAAANSADYRTNAEGNDAYNFYIGHYWPFRQPYTNIVNTLKYFNSWLGIRSVLWAHGETDAEYTNHTQREYVNNITFIINESREVSGLNTNWTIAVGGASLGSRQPVHPITHAQIELGTTTGLNTWPGPNTDTIQVPRFNGHFANIPNGPQGLSLAAQAWDRNLSDNFFSQVVPIIPKGTIHTGAVPSRTFPGASFPVAYKTTLLPHERTQLQAELMDNEGKYTAIIGYGDSNPLWVSIPSGLPSGSYRIRITAVKPYTLPGSISENIIVDSTATETQLIRNFKINTDNSNVYIQWLHTAFPDLNQLVLQKSVDGFHFYDIAAFDAQANRNTSRLYAHTDTELNSKISFYRIKSETGSQVIYSQAVPLFPGSKPPQFTLFPNPVSQDYCMILTDTEVPLSYQVYDANGARVNTQTNTNGISGITSLLFNPSIVNGTYYLRIQGEHISEVKTLLIQR